MNYSEHLIAKLTPESDWCVFNLDYVKDNICYYLAYGEVVSELEFYKIGHTPTDFVERIKIFERRFKANFDSPTVRYNEIQETEIKISKMKQLYKRLSLHQYAKLD